jgi:hypothetical protein
MGLKKLLDRFDEDEALAERKELVIALEQLEAEHLEALHPLLAVEQDAKRAAKDAASPPSKTDQYLARQGWV